MGVGFSIVYHPDVVSIDIPKVLKPWKEKIQIAIEEKLTTAPETFGKPLRRSLRGYRRLRVGDYRVVFRLEKRVVKIFVIQHRSVVYDRIIKKRVS